MKNNISVLRPQNLDELDRALRQDSVRWTFVAGGTDLMVQKEKWLKATHLIDLTALPELHEQIEILPHVVRIGAAVPYGDIINNWQLKTRLPILTHACSLIGAVQIQNRGTIGGNIGNASPAGDTLPVLSVLNAELLIGPRTNGHFKRIPVDKFMTGPGQTVLGRNEYIAFIEIPWPEENDYLWDFRKVGQRKALAISKLSLAVICLKLNTFIREIRIASGSVAPIIRRHRKTEQVLQGKELNARRIEEAAKTLKAEINPIDDIRSTREYRKNITAAVLKDILHRWI